VPTYQYACTQCGHAFEQFQSFTDDALTVCPECEGRLRKVFNAVGVVFKGSGFYRNDSRAEATNGSTPAGSGEKSGDKSGEKSGGSPAKEKPAAATSAPSPSSGGSASRAPASGGSKDSSSAA